MCLILQGESTVMRKKEFKNGGDLKPLLKKKKKLWRSNIRMDICNSICNDTVDKYILYYILFFVLYRYITFWVFDYIEMAHIESDWLYFSCVIDFLV